MFTLIDLPYKSLAPVISDETPYYITKCVRYSKYFPVELLRVSISQSCQNLSICQVRLCVTHCPYKKKGSVFTII